MTKIIIVSFALVGGMLAGCTHVTPIVSSMNYSPEGMEVMGKGEGESRRGYFLCAIPISNSVNDNYSIINAVDDAVLSKKGDALINTVAEHETGWIWPFWCWKSVRVSGTVVKFKGK